MHIPLTSYWEKKKDEQEEEGTATTWILHYEKPNKNIIKTFYK